MNDGLAGPKNMRDALASGRLGNPFAYLGPHRTECGWVVRTFQPGARSVTLVAYDGIRSATMEPIGTGGLFAAPWTDQRYRLQIDWDGFLQETEDAYAFGQLLDETTLADFAAGSCFDLGKHLGGVPRTIDGVAGVGFAVWAPNAQRVSVVGDFNSWDGRRHPMRLRFPSGVWELFVPRLSGGTRYKYEIVDRNGSVLPLKADPTARATELPPATASIVAPLDEHAWQDGAWMATRGQRAAAQRAISIYELHAPSWMRPPGEPGSILDWDGLSERLIPYVTALGFTHIELMPITEHPFGGSWGYQPLSQFAPSARFGRPDGFARFVDACHRAGLGVILDWVPAHFPADSHGLARFDGTPLYEHADPREGFHQDWNTYIYNLGRNEVQAFLIASALYWLEHFHVDGLRVDAVASMLYRDYSRASGEWVPNAFGGRENLEAVAFLRRLNQAVHKRVPDALMIAEESTAWPGVSAPVEAGGLGFSFKWNMGWMHDTLSYMHEDPVHRRWHHGEMTFGLVYAFSERFVLPLSHDEVVHGKGSLYGRMPGDDWQKRANLRAYLTFMWTHPGKKLLFMGGEIGQTTEWDHDGEIPWDLLRRAGHAGIQRLTADLNALYRDEPALHESDADPAGFAWAVGDDTANSVYAYFRRSGADTVLVVINATPVPRHGYRIGVPIAGAWRTRLNSDAEVYGGSGVSPPAIVTTDPVPAHGHQQSISLLLPPLGGIIVSCPT